MKKTRKIFVVAICAMMLLSLLPGSGMSASAVDTPDETVVLSGDASLSGAAEALDAAASGWGPWIEENGGMYEVDIEAYRALRPDSYVTMYIDDEEIKIMVGQYLANGSKEPTDEKPEGTGYLYVSAIMPLRTNAAQIWGRSPRVEFHNYVSDGWLSLYNPDGAKTVQIYLPSGTNSTISHITNSSYEEGYRENYDLIVTIVGHGTLNLTETEYHSVALHLTHSLRMYGGTINCAGNFYVETGDFENATPSNPGHNKSFKAFCMYGGKLTAKKGVVCNGVFAMTGGEIYTEWMESSNKTLVGEDRQNIQDYMAYSGLFCYDFYISDGYLNAKGYAYGIISRAKDEVTIKGGEVVAHGETKDPFYSYLEITDGDPISYSDGRITFSCGDGETAEIYHFWPYMFGKQETPEKGGYRVPFRFTGSANSDGSDPAVTYGNTNDASMTAGFSELLEIPVKERYLRLEPAVVIADTPLYDGDYLLPNLAVVQEKPESGGYAYRNGMTVELHDFEGIVTERPLKSGGTPIKLELYGKSSFIHPQPEAPAGQIVSYFETVEIRGDGEVEFAHYTNYGIHNLQMYSGTLSLVNCYRFRKAYIYGGTVNIDTEDPYSGMEEDFIMYGGELNYTGPNPIYSGYPQEIIGGKVRASGQIQINYSNTVLPDLPPLHFGCQYPDHTRQIGLNISGGDIEFKHSEAPVVNVPIFFNYYEPGTFSAWASTEEDGSNPVDYDPDNFQNYKYFRCVPYLVKFEPAKDENGVYLINNAYELLWFADLVNGGETDADARLTHDIILRDIPWTPIGSKSAPYTGSFDGSGHSIKGLAVTANNSFGALFGCIKNAEIKGFSVTGAITADASATGAEGFGIIGAAEGECVISDIDSSVEITLTDAVSAKYVGGIIGYAGGSTTIDRCSYSGKITAAAAAADGIGGILGAAAANTAVDISDTAFSGSISSTCTDALNIGGIAGSGSSISVKHSLVSGSFLVNYAGRTGRFVGALDGSAASGAENFYDNYYISTAAIGTDIAVNPQNVSAGSAACTAEQLASGEVANKLGKYWYQDIGTDKAPVLGEGLVVPKDGAFESKLHDESKAAPVVHKVLSAGDQAVVYYSGATTGENEYVSVYATDKSGREIVTYYDRLCSAAPGLGTAVVDLTDIDVQNSEIYIVSERYDGTDAVGYFGSPAVISVPASRTLVTNEGAIQCESMKGTYGAEAPLPTAVEKDGYIFDGWYEAADFSGERVYAVSAADAKTYYAKWQSEEDAFVITDEKSQYFGYYGIGSAAAFAEFAALVNGGSTSIKGVLMADIDLSGIDWTPIGNADNKFSGTFDGQGHKITGFGMNITAKGNYGLFGYVSGGTVRDFSIDGAATASITDASTTALSYGVIGIATNAVISDIDSDVNFTLTKNDTANNAEKIDDRIGGIVGQIIDAKSEIERCTFGGTLDLGGANFNNAGGITAYATWHETTIKNCAFTGAITSSYAEARAIGGIIGFHNSANITVTHNLSVGTITAAAGEHSGLLFGSLTNHKNTREKIYNNYVADSYTAYGSFYFDDNTHTDEDSEITYTAATSDQLASGEIAHGLQGVQEKFVWGQTPGTDPYPVIGGAKIYQYGDTYTNEEITAFEIVSHSASGSKWTAELAIPASGTYTVVFADYTESGELNALDMVIQGFTMGKTTVTTARDISLGSGDKIMIWSHLSPLKPVRNVYVIP